MHHKNRSALSENDSHPYCCLGHKDHDGLNKEALEDRLSTPVSPEEITAQITSNGRQASKLCLMCSTIFQRWPATFPRMYPHEVFICQHHENGLELNRSADAGCSLCSQFRRSQPMKSWKALCAITKAWLISGCKATSSTIMVSSGEYQAPTYSKIGGYKLTFRLNRPSCHRKASNNDLTAFVKLNVEIPREEYKGVQIPTCLNYH